MKILFFIFLFLSGCSSVIVQNDENLQRFDLIATSSPNYDKAIQSYQATKKDVIRAIKKPQILFDLPKDETIFEPMDKGQNTKINAIIKPNGSCLVEFEGYIGPENFQFLLKAMTFTEQYKCKEKLVKLSSQGGRVIDGIKMGILIGTLKWDTMAWKSKYIDGCASSCTFAFLAGKKRYGANQVILNRYELGRLGFHQMSNKDICLTDYQDETALLTLNFLKDYNPNIALKVYAKIMFVDCKRIESYNFFDRDLDSVFNADFNNEDYVRFKYK
jgi:hypothetical protein